MKISANRKFNNKYKSSVLVLAMYHILCVVSQNGYYGHFNDMNCNAIVIWWYELWRCIFYILCLKKSM